MRNKIVGFLVIGIAILIGLIIFLFNRGLTEIVAESCTHGTTCPMWGTIDFYTNVSAAIMIFVIFVGFYLVFFGQEEKIITKVQTKTVHDKVSKKEITKTAYSNVLSTLEADEKIVLEKLIENKGSIHQSDLVNATDFNKVKVTRILDKLEGQSLIERRRRGMTNIIILK